ncbi:MAG: ATP-binding cassette domain-containing protein [Gemmatimonadota bacterium]
MTLPDSRSPEYALRLDGVSKRYASHQAVDKISLAIRPGTIFGLLGPNGAGKTTTIRLSLNLMLPDEGTITVLGVPSSDPSLVNRLGYLPEERGLYRKMKVRRVLRFLARLKDIPAAEADRRIDEWLERFQMRGGGRDLANAAVDELSRGMQQKIQFIGTVLHDPELIILDEPFSGLDPVNAQAIKDTVVDLRRRGRSVVFSTHLMDVAERMCDAVAIVNGGKIVLNGELRDVKAQYAGPPRVSMMFDSGSADLASGVLADRTLVSEVDDHVNLVEVALAPGATSQQLLERLVAARVSIARFDRLEPSLHQVFLDRVGAAGVEAGMSGHG